MGYHVVDPATVEQTPDHPCDRRSIAEAVGLSALALAVYHLSPGESLATTYHYHDRREEAFLVLDGTLHVETPDREYAVEPGDLFVVEPGSPIRPFNPDGADAPVRVLGVGAPAHDIGRPYEPDGED